MENFTKLMKIKRYALSTIRSYKNAISLFLNAFPDKNPENISIREIEEFLYRKIKQETYLHLIKKLWWAPFSFFTTICGVKISN
ncbi:phage integrase N-terminal SAM-like domain-containing protein [Thermoflavifilum sp.]|uniref:phage integrase N-terminal SAM-like domain-containing protein n=1 Tax=Thermoflavifilum sp. TaxID=1968839 RepID=UPI0025FBB800|nr:phage integrase N-terminal SAM-like domain-containing protein [Thermoflavifilum sp.]